MDIEIPIDDVSKYAVGLVGVGVLSDAIVGGGAVKFRKGQPLVHRSGYRLEYRAGVEIKLQGHGTDACPRMFRGISCNL